jgi:beta-glucosidase
VVRRNILIFTYKINYVEKLLVDYRFMDANNTTPRFEFGFGLSYTTFSYSSLSISSSTGQYAYVISFTVQNTGNVDGTEKPQLYIAFPAAAGQPKRILRGFDEVKLAAGASSTVSLGLTARDVRSVTPFSCRCVI